MAFEKEFCEKGKSIGKYLAVRFDVHAKEVFKLKNGLELIRPSIWSVLDESGNLKLNDNGTTKYEENTNMLETKPQICTVVAPNDKHPYKRGDTLIVHYMAYETAQMGDLVTGEAFINAEFVFAMIRDNQIIMTDNNYFGQAVYTPEKVTEGGIIFDIGGKKENTQVTITNVPENSKYNTDDVIVSVDRYNYEFELFDKKYIRLKEDEIAGVVVDMVLN